MKPLWLMRNLNARFMRCKESKLRAATCFKKGKSSLEVDVRGWSCSLFNRESPGTLSTFKPLGSGRIQERQRDDEQRKSNHQPLGNSINLDLLPTQKNGGVLLRHERIKFGTRLAPS